MLTLCAACYSYGKMRQMKNMAAPTLPFSNNMPVVTQGMPQHVTMDQE